MNEITLLPCLITLTHLSTFILNCSIYKNITEEKAQKYKSAKLMTVPKNLK